MKLTFWGGVGSVTGSKFLLSFDKQTNILIECGLFQGYKELRLRNWDPLPFKADSLNAVVLTHAHIDHSGYIPLVVKKGFSGPIYCTQGTYDLCEILLADSAHLQEEDAQHANKHSYSKHKPAQPLYNSKDVIKALKQFEPKSYNKHFQITKNVQCEFIRSGHIIGSAFVRLKAQDVTILFSGDLGRMRDSVMRSPTVIENTDYLILECTYGNRLHEKENPKILLKNIINETIEKGGTLLIPAFSVGRSQIILHYLAQLKNENSIPNVPIFLDSPMSISATNILLNHTDDHQLTPQECKDLGSIATFTHTPEESMKLDKDQTPKIIISASGMATGGRILYHLKTYLPDAKNTVLFSGFQSGGTRGARLIAGEKEIKIHGQMIPVQAQIVSLQNASAHADANEIIEWLKHFRNPPKKTFLTHGEADAAKALQRKIRDELGWDCVVPHYGQSEILS